MAVGIPETQYKKGTDVFIRTYMNTIQKKKISQIYDFKYQNFYFVFIYL